MANIEEVKNTIAGFRLQLDEVLEKLEIELAEVMKENTTLKHKLRDLAEAKSRLESELEDARTKLIRNGGQQPANDC
jgi:predicted  nucleic acid-binding Zn-ribbon protein